MRVEVQRKQDTVCIFQHKEVNGYKFNYQKLSLFGNSREVTVQELHVTAKLQASSLRVGGGCTQASGAKSRSSAGVQAVNSLA